MALPLLVNEPETNKGADKPEDSRQEGKSFGRLPAIAEATVGNTTPVEDTGAVVSMKSVDENGENGPPGERQEEIDYEKFSK